jgi:hypothetical protein
MEKWQLVKRAADIMLYEGWAKGSLITHNGVCMQGAVLMAAGLTKQMYFRGDPHEQMMWKASWMRALALKALLDMERHLGATVPYWNDHVAKSGNHAIEKLYELSAAMKAESGLGSQASRFVRNVFTKPKASPAPLVSKAQMATAFDPMNLMKNPTYLVPLLAPMKFEPMDAPQFQAITFPMTLFNGKVGQYEWANDDPFKDVPKGEEACSTS